MRRLGISILAALGCSSAWAQADQVQRGPAPAWVQPSALMDVPANANGVIFMRRQDVAVRLDRQGQAQYLGYRVKILNPNALQLGNISIAWNPSSGTPVVHTINIIRDGKVTDALAKSSFEVLRREDQLEAAKLDGLLTAILHVPDLRVGDELEVAITTPANDPTLGMQDAGFLFLGPDPAAGRYRLSLSWDETRNVRLKLSPDMAAAAVRGEREAVFLFDNPAALSPPKDAPPRYQWQRTAEFSSFKDWVEVSRLFEVLFASTGKLAPGSPIKQEAARIAARFPKPIDRAAAALKLVQQDVRYVYVGLDGGNFRPASAEDTWQRRYGDCKAKTALLLALLGELGIRAEAVLLNSSGTDDGLDQRLPSARMFDHAVVRAHIDNSAYWLDGTFPPVMPPSRKLFWPARWVLPLTAAGTTIEDLGWAPATVPDEITLFEIDARAGFDRPARITSTTIVRGIAGLQQQAQFSAVSPTQLTNALRQQMVGSTWQAIEDIEWRYDEKAAASILTIMGSGTIDWGDDGGPGRSLALPGGGFNPPQKRVRSANQDQNAPFYTKPSYDCHVTTVRVPADTDAKHWSSKPSFDTMLFGRHYYRAFDFRNGAIRMVRASRVEQPEIDAATAQRDNGRIASFDNSMGYIFYDPSSLRSPIFRVKPVPATYEINWAADRVPCGFDRTSPAR